MIFVDSNVIIDVIVSDPEWKTWSVGQIAELSGGHRLVVNQVVVAEVAPRLGSLETFYREIAAIGLELENLNDEAAYDAGVAFQAYRRNRGEAKMVMPDFLIGGHACTANAAILTRDPRFYARYFPTIPLICPSQGAPAVDV